MLKRIKRIRCWFRNYHEMGAYKFRYDIDGQCQHCGVVGTGKYYHDE